MAIRVVVAGATGWTGSAVAKAILGGGDFFLAGAVARGVAGKDAGEVLGLAKAGLAVSATLAEALAVPSDVVVDYTKPDAVKTHALAALKAGRHVVIGTSSFDLQPLQDAWLEKQRAFDEQQAQLSTVDKEVVAQRAKLDPNDIVGQQVLKDLLAQQQGLRDAISARALPEVNQARDAYNAAVAQYNGLCTRPRYSADEIAARAAPLACPAP